MKKINQIKNRLVNALFVLCSLFIVSYSSSAQKTVGTVLLDKSIADKGYTLFSPVGNLETFLIDNNGEIVNKWTSDYRPGLDVELTPSGKLYRTCRLEVEGYNHAGKGGRIEIRSWNDSLEWFTELCFPDSCLHHDISVLPNGNILALVATKKELPEIIQVGKDTTDMRMKVVWTESIIEIKPLENNKSEIVWIWNAWDHFVQDRFPSVNNYNTDKNNPKKYDINFFPATSNAGDVFHMNSIDYNVEKDLILLSVKNINEIWVIDHSTTLLEASTSKGGNQKSGGDIIYRWGNPSAYGKDEAAQIDNQHDACWVIKDGKWTGQLSIFNNNVNAKNSCLMIIKPQLNKKKTTFLKDKNGNFLSADIDLNYCPEGVFGGRQCSFQVLSSGNYLFGYSAKGEIVEYNSKGEIVWRYVNPYSVKGILKEGDPINANTFFKARKYNEAFIKKMKK